MQAVLEFVVDWLASGYGILVLTITSTVSTVLTVVNHIRSRREKVLSCRVRINSPLKLDPPDAGDRVQVTKVGVGTLTRPGLVVMRIRNVGRTPIEPADYIEDSPLTLTFPDRTVASVDVTESTPEGLQDSITRDSRFGLSPDRKNVITLPPVNLNSGHEYKLVVVLNDTDPTRRYEVKVNEGALRHNGRITTEADVRRFRRTTIAGGAVALLLVGALTVALLFTYGRPTAARPNGLACASGELTVEGSSAFGLIATKLAGSYQTYCSDATINVATPGSIEGLNHLRDASPAEQAKRLALSDGIADSQDFPGLVPRPLAVVPYSIVANPKVPVDGLTLDQLRRIFTGQVSTWSEITGNPADTAEVRVVGRTSQSGSRRTLEKYVLGTPAAHVSQAESTSDSCRERRQGRAADRTVVCEQTSTSDLLAKVRDVDFAIGYADTPDAVQQPGVKQLKLDVRGATLHDIRTGYPFWTVEYVYSYGPLPATGSLATAFADYLNSREGRDITAGYQYYPCLRDDGSPEELCTTNR